MRDLNVRLNMRTEIVRDPVDGFERSIGRSDASTTRFGDGHQYTRIGGETITEDSQW
jgi:hypothetical protein